MRIYIIGNDGITLSDPHGVLVTWKQLTSDRRLTDAAVRDQVAAVTIVRTTLRWRGTDSNRRFRDALAPSTARRWCDAA